MRPYDCPHCQARIFFENLRCLSCGSELSYLPESDAFVAHQEQEDAHPRWQVCAHRIDLGCNWLVTPTTVAVKPALATPLLDAATPADLAGNATAEEQQAVSNVESSSPTQTLEAAEATAPEALAICDCCRYTTVVPPLIDVAFLERWRELERAKRALFYSLIRLGLPLPDRTQDPQYGLAFEFLTDLPGQPVTTGHNDGIVTINIVEADAVEREQRRVNLHEPYRTLLGHLRHEIGHFYWQHLLADSPRLDAFRACFGDERSDYSTALKQHYEKLQQVEARLDLSWQAEHISRYASSHPWEDWAETWAHYLHITDALDTAMHWGVQLKDTPALYRLDVGSDATGFITQIHQQWLPLSQYLNAACRSLGESDAYPYVISPKVIEKLSMVHEVIRDASRTVSARPVSI